MKKRILSLLLAVLIAVGQLPGAVFANEADWSDIYSVEDDTGIIPGIGTGDDIYSVEDDTEIIPGIGTGSDIYSVEDDTEIIPGIGTGSDIYSVEDDTEIIPGTGTGEDPAFDYSRDIGKYAQFVETVDSYFVYDSADSYDALSFYYTDFEDGTILRITDWCVDELSGLRYQVEFYSGGVVEEYAEYWPAEAWVLQNYLEDGWEEDSLEFVIVTCDICGEEGCTKEHTVCGGCGALDCTTEHIGCPICGMLDCGVEHEPPEQEDCTPPTTPVIPDDPQLPEEYDVAITDESGVSVTESGFTLGWNEKTSLSAWSTLGEEVSYQWQIFIDDADGGFWVDITGQTGKGILFSRAMLTGALDDTGSAQLRCVTTQDDETVISDPVLVTVFSEADTSTMAMFSLGRSLLSAQNNGIALTTDEGGGSGETEGSSGSTNEDVTIYMVTIEYVYGSGSKFVGQRVSIPYVAEVAAGGTLAGPVSSPNCIGYTPDVSSITPAELGEITGNVSRTVLYNPTEVSYTVRHYLQNVDDDDYTWDTTTIAKGLTEALTSDGAAKNYTGFTALSHYHEEIAADSSTTIDIYYDRDYYLMSFDLDGGHGVDPIYARYDADIEINSDPTKAGYTFVGWDLMDQDSDGDGEADSYDGVKNPFPSLMPAENRTYKALWTVKKGEVKYTVAYWLEDANEDGKYNFWEAFVQEGATADDKVQGSDYKDYTAYLDTETLSAMDTYEKRYSYFDAEKTAKESTDVVIDGDGSTVVDVYYKRNEYTLKFYYAQEALGTSSTYYVIGGSTYRFGASATISDKGNEVALLDHYMSSYTSERGEVDELPTLNVIGNDRSYTKNWDTSTVNNTQYKYHYISFNAKYGEDISKLWPCGVFNSVTRVNTDDDKQNTNWNGTEAFVSAWNGEHHVYYSQHNGNQTIKGNYNELDYQLLFDNNCGTYGHTSYDDSSTVAYLCFWENGADIKWSIPKLFRYNIYVPVLSGQDTTGLTTTTYNGATYYLWATYDTCDDSSIDSQTAPAINGYTYINNSKKGYTITNPDTSKYKEAYAVDFFYTRDQYKLTFVNGDTTVQDDIVYFGADISTIAPKVNYYDSTKADIYEFGGWYTSEETLNDSEFVLTGATMPANNLMLYAGWKLITHNVSIYLTEDLTDPIVVDIAVTHGEPVPDGYHQDESTLKHPADTTATFIGWFYEDENGDEQAFDFATMNILQDMTVYAKWRSNVMKEVEIYYVVEDENGNQTQIADTETLMLRLGQTRTFEAKTGNSLYAEYQAGCFPTTATHSIEIDQEDIDDPNPKTYTFVYKQYGTVPYQVEFYIQLDVDNDNDGVLDLQPAFRQVTLDGKTKAEFVESGEWSDDYVAYVEEHWQNDKAVVVELYEPDDLADPTWVLPDEYLPNALKKQEIIVPSKIDPEHEIEANTIVFIYTLTEEVVDPDDPDAPDDPDDPDDPDNPDNPVYQARYLVQHFIQNVSDMDVYDLYRWSDLTGLSGEMATASAISIPGYTYSSTITDANKGSNDLTDDVLSGTITADDTLELNFYYTVNSYPYQVMYLEEGTNRVLADTKTTDSDGVQLVGLYGSKVTEFAIDIDGYDIVGANTKTIYIQMEAGDTASANTITFFYELKNADLIISKEVALDKEQAAEQGISKIPDDALNQEFTFTIVSSVGFNKIRYDCTVTTVSEDGTTTQTEGQVYTKDATTMIVTLKHGQTIAIHDLIMGTYTITETYVPGFRITVNGNTDAQQKESVSITAELVEANVDVTVSFLNSYPFFVGDLEIGKTVAKLDENDPEPVGDDRYYKVTIELQPDDATREVDRVITFTDQNGNTVTDAYGNDSFTVPNLTESDQTTFTIDVLVPVDGKVILKGAPAGTFTATETVKGNIGYIADFYTVTYNKATHINETATGTNYEVSGVIHGGHPTTVTFNNTYKKGALTIEKTVELEYEKDTWPGDTFTFTVTGTTELPDGTYVVDGAKVTVSGGKVTVKDADGNDPTITIARTDGTTSWSGSLTFENLPAGYYTVTEISSSEGLEKYIVSGAATDLLVNDTAAATKADFTNTYKTQAADLTITRTNAASADQVFVYRVTNEDNSLIIDVTIAGNGTVTIADLPLGNYTVEQLNDWSWRYSDGAKDVEHLTTSGTTVTFDAGQTNNQWLSGNSSLWRNAYNAAAPVVFTNGVQVVSDDEDEEGAE